MAMRICLEEDYVLKMLAKSKKNDLAVVDIDNIDPKYVREAVARGVHVYGYLNACALEKERTYYKEFEDLRIAVYSGWLGEYWVDITDDRWHDHLISEAKRLIEAGCKGVYFDNPDLYYMCIEGFRAEKTGLIKPAPRGWQVYNALKQVIGELTEMGLTVMPNGGDMFVRRLVNNGHKNLIKTVIQEGVLFNNNKRVSSKDKKYFTEYLDWCRSKGIYVRGIEYCTKLKYKAEAKAYYKKHGWQGLYISPHSDLRGD